LKFFYIFAINTFYKSTKLKIMKCIVAGAYTLGFLLLFQATACQGNAITNSKADANIAATTQSSADLLVKVTFSAWGLDRTSFTAAADVQNGTLGLGDKIEGLNNAGTRLGLTVTYIKTEGKEGAPATAGKKALVELTTTDGSSAESLGEDFFIVHKGGGIPAVTTTNTTATPQSTEVSFTYNGKTWKGAGSTNSHLFYSKGVRGMFNDRPFLLLAFRSITAPDDRQLTLKIGDFAGKTGKFDKGNIEVLFSGSEDGDTKKSLLFGCKSPATVTDFAIDITAWTAVSDDEALVSGRFSGTLKGIMVSGSLKTENGQFSNVKVKVYNDKY
jgi:hypothetical protein